MKVPMLDPVAENAEALPRLLAAAQRVLASGRYIGGPEVARFESSLAQEIAVEHAVGCSTGSDALWLALTALDLQPGDEVITTAFSFVASATAIVRAGARPVFVDIDPETFNIDPGAVAAALGPRTRAVLAVHLFGQPADIAGIEVALTGTHVELIEDTAQALGASLPDGRSAGAAGGFGCVSFFPSKTLGGFGDGGAVLTNDATRANRVRRLLAHGAIRRHEHHELGWNCRLDALQAALLTEKLPGLRGALAARAAHARAYDDALAHVPGLARSAVGVGSVHGVYTVRVLAGRDQRDQLLQHLREAEIEAAVYYTKPLYHQPPLRPYAPRAPLEHTEVACEQVLSLPLYPELTVAQREHVVAQLQRGLAV